MKLNQFIIIFLALLYVACTPTANTSRSGLNSSDTTDISKRHQVSQIEVSQDQMIINGNNLSSVTSVKSKYGPQVINFNIISKTDSSLMLTVPTGMKLVAGYIYDLVITDAFGQSTTSISFDVQDDSISTNKIQDASITNSKLSSLGATSAGQVLEYDGSGWVAVSYIGGNSYLGRVVLDTGLGVTAPSSSGVKNGDFYVVNDAAPVTGDLNGDGNIDTYTAGDIIRYNTSTLKWELQSGSGSYVGPWSVSGSNVLRTTTGKVTIAEDPVNGPTTFNVGKSSISTAAPEDSILVSVGGNANSGLGVEWSRAMSFGLRSEHNATMGVYGTDTSVGDADYFYIDVDRDGGLNNDFWNDADFFISMDGNTGIGGVPSDIYRFEVYGNARVSTNLDVAGSITAANLSGNGSGLTSVTAENMANSGVTTIQAGGSGTGEIAFQSETSDFAIYDGNGNLSFGHASQAGSFSASAQLDVRSDSASAVGQFYSYGGNQSSINLGSSQGNLSTPSATASSDSLGSINFGGNTGTGISSSANISATATEGFSLTTMGTELNFYTTANTTNTPQENMRLTNDGRLLVGNSSLGDVSSNSLVVGGDSLLNNNLSVSGVTSLSSTLITGNLAQTGNFSLTGNSTISGTASVSGTTTTNGITNTGLLTNNGNVSVTGTLTVSGLTTFNNDVDLNGQLSLDNLVVDTISGNTTTSTASFGTLTTYNKLISQGSADSVVFEGGNVNDFEIYVSPTNGVRIGNMEDGGAGSVTNSLPVSLYTNSTERMRVTPTGDVGIGTVSPSEKLHVTGNLRVEGATDCLIGNGSGATNCTSDRRLKDNIVNIDNALEKIKSLNGVEFVWNEKARSPGRHDIGVIAQDVQKHFPTAVTEIDEKGWLAVDYAVLVSPLIEAVKELDKNLEMYKLMSEGLEASVKTNTREIASLKEENKKLKSEVKQLKDDNQKMKKAMCSLNPGFDFCQ